MSCINSIKNYKYSILVGKIEKKIKTKKMAKICVPKPHIYTYYCSNNYNLCSIKYNSIGFCLKRHNFS